MATGAIDNDILKIMIHTDTHLGYLERDAHRFADSFATFEEALHNAKENRCDMVIHAGDMFHENKPSRQAMHSAMKMFRQYCLGDDPVFFKVLNEESQSAEGEKVVADDVFKPNGGRANFQSPHQSVSLPYFAIHGNHDDPSKEGTAGDALSALDMLSVSNLINYFGKSERVDDIVVRPIIIQKKNCKVALYGLGAIRDERLNRMCKNKKLRFVRPGGDDADSYFNILVVHQNRDKGRGKNCLRESYIPDWMTLVIWGNEHECVSGLQPSLANSLHILQPGSSVATSLAYTESSDFPKKYAILEIKEDKKFRVKQHNYLRIRPFVFGEVILKEHLDPRDSKVDEKLKAFLEAKVKAMIEEASKLFVANSYADVKTLQHAVKDPHLVLIRLKVESDGFTNLHVQRFGQRFVGSVANTSDLLFFSKKKREKSALGSVKDSVKKGKGERADGEDKDGGGESDEETEDIRKIKIEEFVEEQMRANRSLALLPSSNMQAAIEDYVFRKNASAISEQVSGILRKFQASMIKDKDLDIIRDQASNQEVLRDVATKLRKAEDQATNAAKGKEKPRNYLPAFSDEEDEPPAPKGAASKKAPAKRAPAAKKAKAAPVKKKVTSPAAKARPARGKRKAYAESDEDEDGDDASRASSAVMEEEVEDDDDDDDEEEEDRPKKGRGKKAAPPPKKAPARSRAKKASIAEEPEQSQLELAAPASAASTAPSQGGGRKRAKPSFMS